MLSHPEKDVHIDVVSPAFHQGLGLMFWVSRFFIVCALLEEFTSLAVAGASGLLREGEKKQIQGFLPESQGQNMAVTALHVPNSHDSGQ